MSLGPLYIRYHIVQQQGSVMGPVPSQGQSKPTADPASPCGSRCRTVAGVRPDQGPPVEDMAEHAVQLAVVVPVSSGGFPDVLPYLAQRPGGLRHRRRAQLEDMQLPWPDVDLRGHARGGQPLRGQACVVEQHL
jgi:hypothetical protein